MIPGKYNIICPQGSTFNKQFTWSIENTPVDLTSYSARMQVRECAESDFKILDIDTSTYAITLGGTAGTISIYLDALTTSEFVAKEYVYDLELVSSGGEVTRLIEGNFVVTPEVTR